MLDFFYFCGELFFSTMKKLLLSFFKYLLFWLVYFWVSKLVFLLFNFSQTTALTFDEILKIFTIGTKLDLSMASYLTVFSGILFSLSVFTSPHLRHSILKIYTVILLLVATFLNILDLGLYPHWGTRVSVSAFDYIGDPKGIIANITWVDTLLALGVFTAYLFLFMRFFNLFFKVEKQRLPWSKWYSVPVMLFITASLILPIRGGLNVSPINQSSVSFSNKLYANHAASNYLWNFFNTVERRNIMDNPCIYFSNEEALTRFNTVENQRVNSDTLFVHLNKDEPPNVIMIILESFSNKVISSLGGSFGVCPNLDSIVSESVVFPSFYASGNRSDRGMSAILAGYPSLLKTSIIRFPDKSDKLPMISNYFNFNNYETTFYYGGDIDFYNMKSIVLQGDYNKIVEQEQFPKRIRSMSKWGVPDGYLFDRVLEDVQVSRQPFFTVAYTISSHPPFDVPATIIEGNSNADKYLNSVAYADSCLGAFIRTLKKTELWENTLVVITADHGSVDPEKSEIIEPATYRIPLIWTGGVIKNHEVIDRVGGQPDLMPTLVRQLGGKPDSTLFGHDLFSSPQYAFYMLDAGWGYIIPGAEYYFPLNTGKFQQFEQTQNAAPDFDFAKAYLQVLHDDFLSK